MSERVCKHCGATKEKHIATWCSCPGRQAGEPETYWTPTETEEELAQKELAQKLYGLDLHEVMDARGFCVLRVPGGWIYTGKITRASVFVPYHNEFQD